ncbi:MAG: DNA repair protein RadC [Vicinamibacterales bacterium]
MKDIDPHDRPREKLVRHGPGSLGDNELLAVVIGHGTSRADALSLANNLLRDSGGLHGLLRFTYDGLRQLDGVGAVKAARVLAAVELGRRTLARQPGERTQISSPRDIASFLMPEYGGRSVEQFGLVMLDTRRRVLRTRVVSVGTLDSSPAHPREVFREATVASASAIVLFHNHPSGDPTPSSEDVELTRRLMAAGRIIGIDVLDHVILGDGEYCSLKETGRV